MKGSFYISEYQQTHRSPDGHSTRRMIVEIPESLFRAVNQARGRFSADGVKSSPPFHAAITGLLRAAAKDGEI